MKVIPPGDAFSLGVVILAAGASARMGRAKLLLPWGSGTSVLGHLLEEWRGLGAAQIATVFACGGAVELELNRLSFPMAARILNKAPERGMFSSIQCAAQWAGWQAGLTHWAIVLGDQPHVRRETIQRVLEFSATHPTHACQPARHGHGRHPVLLPKAMFRDLANSTATTLKAFLGSVAGEVRLYEMDDNGLDLDIDRPEDYAQALRLAGLDPRP